MTRSIGSLFVASALLLLTACAQSFHQGERLGSVGAHMNPGYPESPSYWNGPGFWWNPFGYYGSGYGWYGGGGIIEQVQCDPAGHGNAHPRQSTCTETQRPHDKLRCARQCHRRDNDQQ